MSAPEPTRGYPPDRERLCRTCVTWLTANQLSGAEEHVCVPEAGQCRSEYRGDGGPRLGQRIVRCTLARGHEGEHVETDTGNTWPVDARATGGVVTAGVPWVGEDGPPELVVLYAYQPARTVREFAQEVEAALKPVMELLNRTIGKEGS